MITTLIETAQVLLVLHPHYYLALLNQASMVDWRRLAQTYVVPSLCLEKDFL